MVLGHGDSLGLAFAPVTRHTAGMKSAYQLWTVDGPRLPATEVAVVKTSESRERTSPWLRCDQDQHPNRSRRPLYELFEVPEQELPFDAFPAPPFDDANEDEMDVVWARSIFAELRGRHGIPVSAPIGSQARISPLTLYWLTPDYPFPILFTKGEDLLVREDLLPRLPGIEMIETKVAKHSFYEPELSWHEPVLKDGALFGNPEPMVATPCEACGEPAHHPDFRKATAIHQWNGQPIFRVAHYHNICVTQEFVESLDPETFSYAKLGKPIPILS